MEEWRIIYDFPNYFVSNYGRVKNKTGRILKLTLSNMGYFRINLSLGKRGSHKTNYIHKLVAKAFLPNWNNYIECDHKNRDKTDNRYFNLRWITHSNNIRNFISTINKTSKYRGVSYYKNTTDKKWRAEVRINYKNNYLGIFKTEEEGALAYNEFIIKHNLQEFSPLNVIA